MTIEDTLALKVGDRVRTAFAKTPPEKYAAGWAPKIDDNGTVVSVTPVQTVIAWDNGYHAIVAHDHRTTFDFCRLMERL